MTPLTAHLVSLMLALTALPSLSHASQNCPPRLPNAPPEGRIIGGDLATTESASFTATIVNALTSLCTASLLSPFWALTAAHCNPTNATFLFATARTVATGPLLRIKRAIPFNATDFDYTDDIALLELEDAAPLNATFLAVNTDAMLPTEGEFARSVGFGRTMYAGGSNSDLRQVDIPVVSNEECASIYEDGKVPVDGDYMCAGYEGGRCGVCQGDSGGPLLRFEGSKPVVVGVASKAIGCAWQGRPMVFTRVSRYASWMHEMGAVFDVAGGGEKNSANGKTLALQDEDGRGTPAWAIVVAVAVPIAGVLGAIMVLVCFARRTRGKGTMIEKNQAEEEEVEEEADAEAESVEAKAAEP